MSNNGKSLVQTRATLTGMHNTLDIICFAVLMFFNTSVYYNQRPHHSSDLKILLKFLGLEIKIKVGNSSSSCL